MVSSALLIAQADLLVVDLLRAAIARPKNTGPVLEPDLLPARRTGVDRYEPCDGALAPRPVVYTTTAARPARIEIAPDAPPPLDPGAVDFRELQYRRNEAALPAPWDQLPPVAPRATIVRTQIRTIAINDCRELKGTTIDLFC